VKGGRRREAIAALAVVVLTGALLAAGWQDPRGWAARLDHPIHDLVAGLVEPHAEHADQVTVILVDDDSLLRLGERWPLSRSTWARFFRAMAAHSPAVVGVDAWFEVPAPRDRVEMALDLADRIRDDGLDVLPEGVTLADDLEIQAARLDGDRQLGAAIADLGTVLLGVVCQLATDSALAADRRGEMVPLDVDRDRPMALRCGALASSIAPLVAAARGQGGLQVLRDEDGVVRRYAYAFGSGRHAYPSLALAAVRTARPDRAASLTARAMDADDGTPLLRQLRERDLRTLHFADLLEAEAEGSALEDALRDRIVLVGVSAKGTEDLVDTSLERQVPGVYVHAAAVVALLDDALVRSTGAPIRNALILGLLWLLLLVVVGPRIARTQVVVALGLASAILWSVASVMLLERGLWLDVAPLLIGYLAWVASRLLIRYQELEAARRQAATIRDAFSHYLADEVIESLVADPERLQLGGQRLEITAFFSDIAGFTGISEQMEPADLIALLNESLGAMTAVILEEGGIVDKYIGDAIVAIFGAPLPQDDHAARATRAAIRCQEVIDALTPVWRGRGWPEILVRIGLNTGVAVVGNMGSKQRFDYTMIGDTVNLAARLEGVNKVYGTRNLIGETTAAQCGDEFVLRELDAIRVKGRAEGVRVYEPLACLAPGEAAPADVATDFAEGLAAWRDRRPDDAKAAFGRAAATGDPAAKTFLARLDEVDLAALPDDWDGIFEMTTK